MKENGEIDGACAKEGPIQVEISKAIALPLSKKSIYGTLGGLFFKDPGKNRVFWPFDGRAGNFGKESQRRIEIKAIFGLDEAGRRS